VSGKVTDSSGNPVSSASVEFSGGSIPTQISVTTSSTGSYTASSISVGTYDVTASATGQTTTTATTDVNPGTTTTLNIQMNGTSGGGGSGGGTGGACTASTVNRTVTICSPVNNSTVTSPVNVVAQATDSSAVSVSQIYVDGVKQYQVAGGSVNTSLSLSTGTHRITVQAYDSAGAFKSTVYATVGSTSGGSTGGTGSGGGTGGSGGGTPAVTITSPASGATVASPVHVTATASDSKSVSYMQIYLDGVKVYQVSGTSQLDTSLAMSSGSHRLTVQASDGTTVFKSTEYITVQ
jgi:hypothetical protein